MIKIFEYQQTNIMPLVYLRIKAGCCWLKKKKNIIFLSSNKNNSRKIKHRSIERVSEMYRQLNGSIALQWI